MVGVASFGSWHNYYICFKSYIMKKLLSLLFVFTLIACSGGSDDDESMGRTTDPFIGTWQTNDGGEIVTIINNSDGTSTVDGYSGSTWRNASANPNFNSLTQTYILYDGEEEDTETITFASDFSTFTCPECPLWVRQ